MRCVRMGLFLYVFEQVVGVDVADMGTYCIPCVKVLSYLGMGWLGGWGRMFGCMYESFRVD